MVDLADALQTLAQDSRWQALADLRNIQLLLAYEEGASALADVTVKSRAGLDAIADWMPRYHQAWSLVSERYSP